LAPIFQFSGAYPKNYSAFRSPRRRSGVAGFGAAGNPSSSFHSVSPYQNPCTFTTGKTGCLLKGIEPSAILCYMLYPKSMEKEKRV
jgi:hypothetical protein